MRERLLRLTAPVLERPVVVIESDDWGPGPADQALALAALRERLLRFRDLAGNPAVMTIGVVLSIPDPEAIAATGEYRACLLDAPAYRPIVEALLEGERAGVFALQLHGMAHFWPPNLIAAWRQDNLIQSWLAEDGWRTEKLPAWLQSRWIDAACGLPSKPLPAEAIRRAVAEETACFSRCFGRPPKVVVPPTFVWDENVERAYAEAGVEVLITPGRRFPGRDAQGRLLPADRSYRHGQTLASGLKCLVRDVYFEPALGHDPAETLAQIESKWSRREPALLETHRFNFLDGTLDHSLAALERLLQAIRGRLPEVRFLSSYALAMEVPPTRSLKERLQAAWRRLGG